jgi:predicted enzyme related to lactoylglutathione lyase
MHTIQNTVTFFEIQSSDLEKSIHFYQNVFGWKFIREAHHPIAYYRIEMNGIIGGLMPRPAKIPPPEYGANAFTCSVLVDSYDTTANLIVQNGGKVAFPKFAIPGRCW